MKGGIGSQGYIVYCLISDDGKQKLLPIHVILATTFIGPCPEGMEVRHLDDNKLNNATWNLAYGTRQQNVDDARRNGRIPRGEGRPSSKLTEPKVEEIYRGMVRGESQTSLARRLGVSLPTVNAIVTGRNWRHVRERVGYTYVKPRPVRVRARPPRNKVGDQA